MKSPRVQLRAVLDDDTSYYLSSTKESYEVSSFQENLGIIWFLKSSTFRAIRINYIMLFDRECIEWIRMLP